MARVRLNLSTIKGMNTNDHQHADNEVVQLINLKPTENGLEMRNGAKELLKDATNGALATGKNFTGSALNSSYRTVAVTLSTGDVVILFTDASATKLKKLVGENLLLGNEVTVDAAATDYDLAVDASDNLYVVYNNGSYPSNNCYIEKYDSTLKKQGTTYQVDVPSQYPSACAVCAMPNGNICVVYGDTDLRAVIYNSSLAEQYRTVTTATGSGVGSVLRCKAQSTNHVAVAYVSGASDTRLLRLTSVGGLSGSIVTQSGTYIDLLVGYNDYIFIANSYGSITQRLSIYTSALVESSQITPTNVTCPSPSLCQYNTLYVAFIYVDRNYSSIQNEITIAVYDNAGALLTKTNTGVKNNASPLTKFGATYNTGMMLIYKDNDTSYGKVAQQKVVEYQIVESGQSMITSAGEYLFKTSADLLKKSGNLLFGNDCEFIKETVNNGVLALNKAGKNYVGTIHAPFSVMFRQSTTPGDSQQDLAIFEWNPDLMSVMNAMLCQRDAYETGNNAFINTWITVAPKSLFYTNNNTLYLFEGAALQYFDVSYNRYSGSKTQAQALSTTACASKARYKFYANGTTLTNLAQTTTITASAAISRVIPFIDSALYCPIVTLEGGNTIVFYWYYQGTGFTKVTNTINDLGTIKDIQLLYYEPFTTSSSPTSLNTQKISLLVLTETQVIQVFCYINSNTLTYVTTDNVVLADTDRVYTGLAAQQIVLSTQTSYAAPTYFLVYGYNGEYINYYSAEFDWATGTYTPLQNVKLEYTLTKADFPFVAGDITDIAIAPTPGLYEMNTPLAIGVRPFWGYNADTDAVVQSDLELYNLPVMANYENAINVENPFKLKVYNAATTTRWINWMLYVIPAPKTETALTQQKLCKGYNADGYYQLKAWYGEGDETAGYVDKAFPFQWAKDSVVLLQVNQKIIVAEYLSYTAFLDQILWSAGVNSVTELTQSSATDINAPKVMAISFKSSASGERTISTWHTHPLKKGKKYKISFDYITNPLVGNDELYVEMHNPETGLPADWTVNQDTGALGSAVFTKFTTSAFQVSSKVLTEESNFCMRFIYKGASAIDIKIANLILYECGDDNIDNFRADTAYRSKEQEKINMVDYISGTFNALLDKQNNRAVFTEGNVLFNNLANAVSVPNTPVAIVETGFGYVVATKYDTFLFKGLSFPMPRYKILDTGLLSDDDRYALAGRPGYAVIYNENSVWLITAEGERDIGKNIWPFITTYTGVRYVAVDQQNDEIYIPINISALGAVAGKSTTLQNGFAIWSISRGSWRVVGYQGDVSSTGFVRYSKIFENMIGDTGGRISELEIKTPDAEDAGYLNETWDKMVTVLQTRNMSLSSLNELKNIMYLWMTCNLRRPSTDQANYDYLNCKFYQDYNPTDAARQPIMNLSVRVKGNSSAEFGVDVNMYNLSLKVTMARETDSENPKLTMVDIQIEKDDTGIMREGGW